MNLPGLVSSSSIAFVTDDADEDEAVATKDELKDNPA